jgi:hypothetical protein
MRHGDRKTVTGMSQPTPQRLDEIALTPLDVALPVTNHWQHLAEIWNRTELSRKVVLEELIQPPSASDARIIWR